LEEERGRRENDHRFVNDAENNAESGHENETTRQYIVIFLCKRKL